MTALATASPKRRLLLASDRPDRSGELPAFCRSGWARSIEQYGSSVTGGDG